MRQEEHTEEIVGSKSDATLTYGQEMSAVFSETEYTS